jgi:hypothetical protein
MSQAPKKKAKKSQANGTFDRPLKSSQGPGCPTKFALEYEARIAAQEQAEPGWWFALWLSVQHVPMKGASGTSLVRPHGAKTPPDLPREVLVMIIGQQRKMTLAELLEKKQRVMIALLATARVPRPGFETPDFTNFLHDALPSLGAADQGYRNVKSPEYNTFENGQLSFALQQRVDPGEHVTFKMSVDLKQVVLREGCSVRTSTVGLVIPDTAVTVETDVRQHMERLKLTPARVAEMEGFQLKAHFSWGGKYINFRAAGTGQDSGLGFQVHVNCPWMQGIRLDSHSGLQVGDRVRVREPFKMYAPFAVGQEGVLDEIRMFNYAVFYVNLADPALVMQVEKVHKGGRGLQEFQHPWQLASRRFQLDLVGVKLDAHDGLKVGDRVRIKEPFKLYAHFATGQAGVLRDIRMLRNAVYYVELEDPTLAAQAEKVHTGENVLQEGQLAHQISCARFQLESI